MVRALGTGERRNGALPSCLGRAPRRLAIMGGFVLLGWLGLAIASAAHASADPTPAAPAPVLAQQRALVDSLPVVGELAPSIESALRPVTDPLASAVAPVLAPASPLVDTVAQAVRPVSQAASGLVAPVDHAVAQVASPVASTLGHTVVEPLARTVRAVTGSGAIEHPGPPAPVGARGSPAPGVTVPVPSRTHRPPRLDAAPSTSRPDPWTRPAMPLPTRDTRTRTVGRLGMPAPAPAVPPAAPDVVTMGSASGSAATSNPGSGSAGVSGCNAAESWASQHLSRLGVAAWDGASSVRNDAARPPVSPD